jgi:serine/threonine-protein kinase
MGQITAQHRGTEDASSPNSVKPGETVAEKYVIERLLGVGSSAVVVAARHTELDETVVIKFLRPELHSNGELVKTFTREAQAAKRIKGEHTARVYEVGVMPGRGPYLVMEFLTGKDVATVLAEGGAMPLKRAVDCVMEACEGLAVAHATGIVHRDVRPGTLFLALRSDGSEIVKVLDFGVTRAALGLDTEGLVGSVGYMAPERIRSRSQADPRTDTWSLAVVLYELLTRHLPFRGDTVAKVSAAVLDGEPSPLTTYITDVPEGLQAVLDRALHKQPAARFQSVAELAIALLPFASSQARVHADRALRILRAAGQASGIALPFSTSGSPPSDRARSPVVAPVSAYPGRVSTSPEALQLRPVNHARKLVIAVAALILALGTGAILLMMRPQPRAPVAEAVAPPATTRFHPVSLDSDPAGARVEWNGKPVGETPATFQLPAGTQVLRVTKDGYVPEYVSVTVTPDSPEHPRVTLQRLVPPQNSTPALGTAQLSPGLVGHPTVLPRGLVGGVPRGAKMPPPPPLPPPVAASATPPAQPPAPTPPAVAAKPPPPAPASASAQRVRIFDDGSRVRLFDDQNSSKPP